MPDNIPTNLAEYGPVGTIVAFLSASAMWAFKALWQRDEASRAHLVTQLDAERACTQAERDRNESLHAALTAAHIRVEEMQARTASIERANAAMHKEHREWRTTHRGIDSPPSATELRLAAMQADIVRALIDTPDEPPPRSE